MSTEADLQEVPGFSTPRLGTWWKSRIIVDPVRQHNQTKMSQKIGLIYHVHRITHQLLVTRTKTTTTYWYFLETTRDPNDLIVSTNVVETDTKDVRSLSSIPNEAKEINRTKTLSSFHITQISSNKSNLNKIRNWERKWKLRIAFPVACFLLNSWYI